jgi:hypothetical protein
MEMLADTGSKLIGWHGDSFNPQEVFPKHTECVHTPIRLAFGLCSSLLGIKAALFIILWYRPYQISEHPRAYVWKNFLTAKEAQHIVELAAPRMKRSLVGGGQQVDSVCCWPFETLASCNYRTVLVP